MKRIRQLRKIIPVSIRALLKQITGRDLNYSYSQFGEDAYLSSYFKGKTWKINKSMSLPRNGFYVDIGAYSPTECSNTYIFYRRGWHGINVDATPKVMDAFRLLRRRDINLNMAIGGKSEEMTFYSWGAPCVFNTADPAIAEERASTLGRPPEITRVQCLTLCALLDEYLPAGQNIDFMTVDVEGLDLDVLKSNNWERYRPELVIAEAYSTELGELVDTEIYKFMLSQGYACISWIKPSIVFCDQLRK